MAGIEYHIVVVDNFPKPMPSARKLVEQTGMPPRVVVRWAEVVRQMSPSGLKRKLRNQVN